jgi:tRNA modification GTPase
MDLGFPLGNVPVEMLVWPTRRSYTRQPSVEIHGTAAPPVLHEMMRRLGECGIRPAAPGEFTLRAFLAGRIDLTQAEAVLGVIDSRNHSEMQLALQQLAGGLAGPIDSVRELLLDVTAQIEAGLDFVEDDIEFISGDAVVAALGSASRQLQRVLENLQFRSLSQSLVRVALCGPPNSGKSSLFNALALRSGQSGDALVSSFAGTTRDYTTCTIESRGVLFQLMDTAGTHAGEPGGAAVSPGPDAPIEARAEQFARMVRDTSHIVVYCFDNRLSIDESMTDRSNPSFGDGDVVFVSTKTDLPGADASRHRESGDSSIGVSSVTGDGINQLIERLVEIASGNPGDRPALIMGTAERCAESLQRAARELEIAEAAMSAGQGDEIVAAALRIVLDELAVVTGRVYTDDILDRVFSRFCIGK